MDLSSQHDGHLKQLLAHIKKTGDSEPEQALLRLAIGVLLVGYFCLPWGQEEELATQLVSFPSIVTIIYYSNALFIFLAIVWKPVASPSRRVYGAALDMISLSIVMYHSGVESVPLFVLYLWVILGNGFRYGTIYLYISLCVGLFGFSAAVIWGQFWQEHQPFAVGLLIMLCLLPLYAAFLLKKLHAAITMAKHANEAKSRFLANMSHELRTPLNGVIGMGELLRETKLNHEQLGLVESMHSSANTLLELIENILDISKIEAGKLLATRKDFDLHNLINSVLNMLVPMGERKGLRVSCNFDPETPFELVGDQRYIHQILVNLVSNAIKFTEKGSVVLSIKYAGGTESRPRVRFEVIDTGIGLSEDSISKIFDNFTQADASTSRAYGGTGLGTTISKELVELMGGDIGVNSKIGKGSTFWFELPFTTSRNSQSSIFENRILLLADEDTAAIIRPSLKTWSIDFKWVRTSTRALSELLHASDKSSPYETILVDQASLTDINAIQFAKLVRSDEFLKTMNLVLINSSDTMIDANRSDQFYISTIVDPEDKRLLFNAIHAAQSVSVGDNKIVPMAEHYSKHAGAPGLNILVAEDNQVNQQVVHGILQNAGHKVRIASTGEQALDIISADLEDIDIIILDMNMPELSGIEVVKSLRFMDTKSNIPVIMLTADATPEAKESSISAGVNKFLTKPIDSHGLLETIAVLSKNVKSSSRPPIKSIKSSPVQIQSCFDKSEWYDHMVLYELQILGGNPEFINSLLKSFDTSGRKHLHTIKSALHDDYLEYRESLHALKGSATELGGDKLVEACLKAEALKPYDLGSEKILSLSVKVEEIFNKTVTALLDAVTANQKSYPGKSLDPQ
ncbi:MAG: response regulator [Gammaproteobacteria bacterium]|nr:response regulator [Gammaproteobacteria bacterium]